MLVDPNDPADIARGALSLLRDRDLNRSCAEEGLARCGYYDWSRHAEDYVRLCAQVARRPAPLAVVKKTRHRLIVSDIDETLTGDREALRALSKWLERDTEHYFAVATGRSLHAALAVMRDWDVPMPDALVTSVGAEIYYARAGEPEQPWALVRDEAWSAMIGEGWDHEAVTAAVLGFGDVTLQPPREQRPHKASFLCPDDQGFVRSLRRYLSTLGIEATVIFSHGEMLDVLPARASKGAALDHLRARLRVRREDTIACGDSGNDELLLRAAGWPVIVANRTKELDELIAEGRCYVSSYPSAAGVLDGVTAFAAARMETRSGAERAWEAKDGRGLSHNADGQRLDDRQGAAGPSVEPGPGVEGRPLPT